MKKDNPIVTKSYTFALNIIHVYQEVSSKKNEYVLSKQLLRSGTSIGANIEEAQGAISKKEFIAKIHISFKEARESRYWLSLLRDSNYLEERKANLLISKCDDFLKIMTSILKSSKENNR